MGPYDSGWARFGCAEDGHKSANFKSGMGGWRQVRTVDKLVVRELSNLVPRLRHVAERSDPMLAIYPGYFFFGPHPVLLAHVLNKRGGRSTVRRNYSERVCSCVELPGCVQDVRVSRRLARAECRHLSLTGRRPHQLTPRVSIALGVCCVGGLAPTLTLTLALS